MKKLILIVCAVMSAMTMNAQSGFGLMGVQTFLLQVLTVLSGGWEILSAECMIFS